MRKIYGLIVFILLLFPIGVFAKDDTITIDFNSVYIDESSISSIQQDGLKYLIQIGELKLIDGAAITNVEDLNVTLSGFDKEKIKGYTNKDNKLLVLFDNKKYVIPSSVTAKDNISVTIDHSLTNVGYDINNYAKINVKFGEVKDNRDILICDLTKDMSLSDMTRHNSAILEFLSDKGLIEIQEDENPIRVLDDQGKRLFDIDVEQQMILEARGLNYKDNIVVDLSKEDREVINNKLGINSNYKQVKLVFAQEEKSSLSNPKTYNIIIFPISLLILSFIIMIIYCLKNKRNNQDA